MILEHLPKRLHEPLAKAEMAEYFTRHAGGQAAEGRSSSRRVALPEHGRRAHRGRQPAAPASTTRSSASKDMDIDGVEAEILYVGCRWRVVLRRSAPSDQVEASRAVNSAAIEWASVDPKRLMPVYILPIDDIKASVKEVERVVAEHGKAVQVPLIPREQGAPPYWDESYDPLWEVLTDTGVPISQHVGANRYLIKTSWPRTRRRSRASSSRCRRSSCRSASPTGR